jgi:16S rRNA (cytidine1402-2'-O)-methyltransferase
MVLYESPHRLLKTLNQIAEFLGDNRKGCVVRELTKIFETFQRGSIKELINYYDKNPVKGEIVLLVEGK